MPNSSQHFSPLSEAEKDALGELANMAMGQAATRFAKLVEQEVTLTVPAVQILSQPEALALMTRKPGEALIGVSEEFRGLFKGRVLLIFPEKNSLELVRLVVGRNFPLEDLSDLETEAIAETGNIVLNAWVATMANLLKRNLVVSVPQVVRGHGIEIFEGARLKVVLFLQIDFAVRGSEITGYVVLLMDLPSMHSLRVLIAEFIRDHS